MVTSSEVSRPNEAGNRSICAGRCVCLHAFSQWATLALESLLLHHGLLSAPLSLLEKKEAEGGEKVRDALRRAMKGRRHQDISEASAIIDWEEGAECSMFSTRRFRVTIAVCFGLSPLLVHRVYRLPVSVCCEEGEERAEEEDEVTLCGSPCAALNATEQRKINRHLFTMFPPEASSAKMQRVYIVVRGNDSLLSEDMTEVDGISRAKEGEITLEWSHSGCGRRMKEEEGEKRDEESIHMRLKQFIGKCIVFREGRSYSPDYIRRLTQNTSIKLLHVRLNDTGNFHRELCNLIKDFEAEEFSFFCRNAELEKEIVVESFLLEWANKCKMFTASFKYVTPETFHKVYKVMVDDSTQLRSFGGRITGRKFAAFLGLLGITYSNGEYNSDNDLKGCFVNLGNVLSHDPHVFIFDGLLEIDIEYDIFNTVFGGIFHLKLHETQESLEESMRDKGMI